MAVLVACAIVRSSASFSGKSAMNFVNRSRDSTQKSESALVRSVADLRMFCRLYAARAMLCACHAGQRVRACAQHRRANWEYSNARRTPPNGRIRQ